MTLFDSFAVIAYLRDEPAAAAVAGLLANDDVGLTAIGVAEVVDRMIRLEDASEDELALDLVQLGLLDAPELDATTCRQAGALRSRHYHRRDRAVSLADCVLAASALRAGATVATADPHLLDMCVDEGIDVFPLPDLRGITWTRR